MDGKAASGMNFGGCSTRVSGLEIGGLTLWAVENRIPATRSHGVGSISGSVKRIVLRIDTNGGPSGYGEAAPWAVFSGTIEACFSTLRDYFWPVLRGSDLSEIPKTMARCERAAVGQPEAKAAIETALYDIVGKASGLPLYQLLGGKARDRIPLSYSLANPDLQVDLETALSMYEEGLRIFKIKTGYLPDHRDDVRRVESVRNALPDDAELRIDYNQGLSAFDALRKLRLMEPFAPTFIEQPVKADEWEAMADLTARLDTPIMADESIFDPAAAWAAARQRIANAFSVKLMKAGGLTGAQAIATIALQAGIPCYGGTLFEGPVALNAAAHLIAATDNISLGCEFYMPRYVMRADELEAGIDIRNGTVYPPSGPGLGLEVDEDALGRTALDTVRLQAA